MKRVSVSRFFIKESRELVSCFGAVRYDSFIRYLELYFDISADGASRIVEKLLAKQYFVKANYSATAIIKNDKSETANYDSLDAFEAYLGIFEEEKHKNPENEVSAMKTELPTDFVFYSTSGFIYDVIINNDRGAQKVKLLEKAEKKKYKDQITLFVFPSGADLSSARPPALPGKYRLAVVRRSDSGRATCAIGAIEGK